MGMQDNKVVHVAPEMVSVTFSKETHQGQVTMGAFNYTKATLCSRKCFPSIIVSSTAVHCLTLKKLYVSDEHKRKMIFFANKHR